MPLVSFGLWIASAVFGWQFQAWWLIVPPAVWFVFAFGKTAAIGQRLDSGFGGSREFSAQMAVPNIMLVVWNTAINFVIFFIAAGVSAIV